MIQLDGLNSTLWALAHPMDWAHRFSNRTTLGTPLFIEIDRTDPGGARARLLDITGGVDPDWSPISRFENQEANGCNCWVPVDPADSAPVKEALGQGNMAKAACLMIAAMAQRHGDQWEDLARNLEETRYEANAWFERDNRQLTLLDLISNQYVVDLQGDDVDEAIESGYLSRPRAIRPSDSDWVAPLLEYARSLGLAPSLEDLLQAARSNTNLSPENTERARPATA